MKVVVNSIFKMQKMKPNTCLERVDYMKIIEVEERPPILVQQLLEVWENL